MIRNDDLISKKTRMEFRNYFSSYSTLSVIRDEFEAADVMADLSYDPEINGERRTLVDQYYHTVDFQNARDARKVLEVFAAALGHLEGFFEDEDPSDIHSTNARKCFKKLTQLLRRDGWEYDNGVISPTAGENAFDSLLEHVDEFDLLHIRKQIERMTKNIDSDPDAAIGASKELVESCCKTILKECNEVVKKNTDLVPLVKQTIKQLKLTPDDVPDTAKASKEIKQLLHKLAAIVHELGFIRNQYGSGHGKDGKFVSLPPRHARLMSGMAGTLAMFLFETHEARKN